MKPVTQLMLFLVGVSAFFTCLAAPATDSDVLADVRNDWMFAIKEGDAAKLAAVFAENGTIMPPGFPSFTGRKAIEDFYRDGFAALSVRDVELHPKERHTGGNSVREHGTYKITWVPKNEEPPYTTSGRYLFIGVKRPNGKWEIAWEMHTIETKVPPDQL